MYTLLMNSNKSLMTTKRTTLYQQENLVDKIQFLFPTTYGDIDLTTCKATLIYVDQGNVSHSESLAKDTELYKNRLRYVLPVDSELNYFAGTVIVRIVLEDADAGINIKTGEAFIRIEPYRLANNDIPDDITSEKIEKIESDIDELKKNQVDDLILTDDLLQLSANSTIVGNGVILPKGVNDESDEEGYPAFDFDTQGVPENPDESELDNVVLF